MVKLRLDILDRFYDRVAHLGLPRLGPDFKDLSVCELQNALVAHRLLDKYDVPSLAIPAKVRREQSISKMMDLEAQGLTSFNWRELQHETRCDFLASREWLRIFFRDFRHTYKVRFPSNETYVSASGRTDLITKLSSDDQWHVSPDLFDYVVEILLRDRGLLTVVKQRFWLLMEARVLHDLHRREILAAGPCRPFYIRKAMITMMFRRLVTCTRTSRVTTVPKTTTEDRVITCECLWSMVAQLSFAHAIRVHLKKKLGYDLESRQAVHRSLIRTGRATIDLSKASDRNYMVVLRDLFPERIFKVLERMRSGILEHVTSQGEVIYHPLKMFAPMGTGCTFEVMTLVLLAHTRTLDSGSSVFGDDIIIDKGSAPRLIRNLEAQGWKINDKKSFVDGPFRESCGSFADLRTDSFLLSFDLPRPTSQAEFFIFCHKMWRLGDVVTGELRNIFVETYAELIVSLANVVKLPRYYEDTSSTTLIDWGIYVPPEVGVDHVKAKTAAHHCLQSSWQRVVHAVPYSFTRPETRPYKGPVSKAAIYANLRALRVVERRIGKNRTIARMVDGVSGCVLTDVPLVSVL